MINNNTPAPGLASSPKTTSSPISKFSTESLEAMLPSPTSTSESGANILAQQSSTVGEGWVAKRGPGKLQLINSSVFGELSQAKVKERLRRKEEKEKLKLRSWIQKSRGPPYSGSAVATAHAPHEVMIAGERYQVAADGSKLVKISGESVEQTSTMEAGNSFPVNPAITDGPRAANTTPKRAIIGGVNFVRSKNGNLWRSGLVKASR